MQAAGPAGGGEAPRDGFTGQKRHARRVEAGLGGAGVDDPARTERRGGGKIADRRGERKAKPGETDTDRSGGFRRREAGRRAGVAAASRAKRRARSAALQAERVAV